MARKKCKGTELSVFKGREAKLNRAIFQVLAKTPQTIYDIHKQVENFKGFKRIRYGSVNRRVNALSRMEYLKAARIQVTKAGFEATVYELRSRAYLAIKLDSLTLQELFLRIDENTAEQILALLSIF